MRSIRLIMILAGKQLLILSRMRAALAVIFLPGVVLYTIFTLIFAGPAGRPFKAAVIDEDQTQASRELISALADNNVTIIRTEDETPEGRPLTIETAKSSIRGKGKFRVALVIPNGYSNAPNVLAGPAHQGVQLYFDETQPAEADIIVGMLQMAAGRNVFAKMFHVPTSGPANDSGKRSEHLLIRVERRGVAITRMPIAAKHTFLAGIVPMFLLFGATGAVRGLLDEIHGGQIRRMLAAPISPGHIWGGQMLSTWVVSMLQCTVMYLFAWLVFGVDIWQIWGGLLLLTMATALACVGFGMLMGSLCRTGEQLDGLGTLVILAMSAIGGSMVPRFVMPELMQTLGLFTINGWAYDGFIALVRNEGFRGMKEEFAVLLGIAAACATAGSILLSRRLRTGTGE